MSDDSVSKVLDHALLLVKASDAIIKALQYRKRALALLQQIRRWRSAWRNSDRMGKDMLAQRAAMHTERDALAAALAEAERAQMERDCAAVCGKCRIGEELKYYDGDWYHLFRGHLHNGCSARLIRAAFAALHPEPAP